MVVCLTQPTDVIEHLNWRIRTIVTCTRLTRVIVYLNGRTYTHEVVPQWTYSNGGVSCSSYGRDMVQDPVNGSDAVSNWTNADGCVSQTHQTAQRPDHTYSTNKVDCVASRNHMRKGGACPTKVGSHDVEPQVGGFCFTATGVYIHFRCP